MKKRKSPTIDIKHIATLAKFSLTEGEEKKFSEQLAHVLDYFANVSEVRTQGVRNQGQVTVEENRFREDEIQHERILTQKEALGQAKRTYNGFFVVDAVLDKA